MPNLSAGAFSLVAHHRECNDWLVRLASEPVTAAALNKLRQDLHPGLAECVIEAASLQDRASKKLGPGRWWITRRSLQQATAWQVARLKSAWFGDESVYDLCCGIGGDAIQLAKRGQVNAVDKDPIIAQMAELNLCQSERSVDAAARQNAAVQCADVTAIEIPTRFAIHVDPDRRSGDRRSINTEHHSPSWRETIELVGRHDAAVVKLAPGTEIDSLIVERAHRCWTSLQGSVREQSLLFGSAIQRAGKYCGGRSAVVLNANGEAIWFSPEKELEKEIAQATPAVHVRPQSVLVDPDPAIRAAGLTETFAATYGLRFTHNASGFLTAPNLELASSEIQCLSTVGRIQWCGAFDDRKLRRELRLRNVYPARIKVRGSEHDPAALARRYRKCGDQPISLWIGRSGDRVFAAICSDARSVDKADKT